MPGCCANFGTLRAKLVRSRSKVAARCDDLSCFCRASAGVSSATPLREATLRTIPEQELAALLGQLPTRELERLLGLLVVQSLQSLIRSSS